MIRALVASVLAIHGLIHLIGFVHAWGLATIPAFTGKTLVPLSASSAKLAGVLWLLVCLGFLAAAVTYLRNRTDWWAFALPSLFLSQLLIILYWSDAKAGTVANVLILVLAGTALAAWRFDTSARKQALTLQQEAGAITGGAVTSPMLEGLPPVVRTWLERSQVVGKPLIHTVHLKQQGQMRTEADGRWMLADAEQFFTVAKPGFVWKAHVQMAPLLEFTGVDKYENGHGNMQIKLMSMVSMVNSQGKEVDQGTLLRYLSEIIWFPTAALSPYLRWEGLTERSARATMSYGGVTASGIFHFNEQGDVESFETQRYMEKNGKYSLETWMASGNAYKSLCNGIRIPTEGSATWKLKTGDFTWYKLKITDVAYNQPMLN